MKFAVVLLLSFVSLTLSFCPQFATFEETTNTKQNPFNQLTSDEFNQAYQVIFDKFNLTSLEDAGPTENYVELLTLNSPKKYETLDYLNDDGRKPDRYAKAVIVHGTDSDPSIRTYTVGPLNQDNIQVQSTNTPPIPHNSRRTKAHKDKMMEKVFVYYALAPISDIIEDLLGKPWNLEEYMYLDQRLNLDGDKRLRWIELSQKPDDSAFVSGCTNKPRKQLLTKT